jgi:hypothetical protein
MDIVEKMRPVEASYPEMVEMVLNEKEAEITLLRQALLHIAWGGIQSVDDAEKYARKALEDKENGL